jgi:hypothetical protein
MDCIARKRSREAGHDVTARRAAQGLRLRRRVSAWAAIATLIVSVAAIGASSMVSAQSGSDDPVSQTAAPTRKRKHPPTPQPTPMALPAEVKAKLPAYKPGPSPFHDGEQLVYQASWVAIPAAQARIEFHKKKKDPSQWVAEIWIETNAAVDLLYKMRDYMRESVANDSLHSAGVNLTQHENARLNNYTVTFDRPAQIVSQEKKNKKGAQTRQYVASDPWGPLSGAMIALTQELAPGKTYALDVFSGSQRYVFAFEVEKKEKIHLAIGDFDAWRIVPDVWYVSDGNLRNQAHGTTLWVSADKRHLPLRIEAQAFIGYVRADLIRIDGVGVAESAGK